MEKIMRWGCLFIVVILVGWGVWLFGNAGAVDNKFYIGAVDICFFDVVNVDGNGCAALDTFLMIRDNELCAMRVSLKKEFYLDEDTVYDHRSPFWGYVPQGMSGPRSKIESLTVQSSASVLLIKNVENVFFADTSILNIRYRLKSNDSSFSTEVANWSVCTSYEPFSSIEQFVRDFNRNALISQSEYSDFELLLFAKKKEFVNLLAPTTSVVMNVNFQSEESLRAVFRLN